jgi:hypothetical protein
MDIVSFTVQNGSLVANGLLDATLYDVSGNTIGSVTDHLVTGIPVDLIGSDAPQRTCDILHLVLGPLDLNLLGLQVDLSRVVLDITAQTGPGNLLGNLLCAITGLLDGGLNLDVLNQIAGLLNRIIDLLRW